MARPVAFVAAVILTVSGLPASAQIYSVAHSFTGGSNDGYGPFAGLMEDKGGNFWGTTYYGGPDGSGTIFELGPNIPGTGATAPYSVVHCFPGNQADGHSPDDTLVEDMKGDFWGTTYAGGDNGYGTLFKIATDGTYSVVHSFPANGTDGYDPAAGLIRGRKGTLWGTTYGGGQYGVGTVYEIAANGTYSIVHSFNGNAADGSYPFARLLLDKNGNLWGTTLYGGTNGLGTIFEITADGTYTVVHNFPDGSGSDGYDPYAGLMEDKSGNLWGTTYHGGANGFGTIFEITAGGTYSVVHSFNADGTDGYNPSGGLSLGRWGGLWGTTVAGGANNAGTVFEINARGVYSVAHSFADNGVDGYAPSAGLLEDKKGNLWGTTFYGGAEGAGTVFEIVPEPK